uniref:Uncharacterized protein n=1 Tax=Streptomyces sp. NBC_00093 TaxID=2975649 RepID=A0AAU2AIB3_9ACTN
MTEAPRRVQRHEVELVPERTLGTPHSPESLRARFSFGSDVLPVAEGTAPPEWVSYATALAPHRTFCVLAFGCTFQPEDADSPWTFEDAALGVALTASNPSCSPSSAPSEREPLARRVDPVRLDYPVSATPSTLSMSVNAGVVGASVERPIDGASKKDNWIVRSVGGSSQSRLRWEFRGTRQWPLVGDHDVKALVELVPGQGNAAEVLFAATLKHRLLGIRRYHPRHDPKRIPLSP